MLEIDFPVPPKMKIADFDFLHVAYNFLAVLPAAILATATGTLMPQLASPVPKEGSSWNALNWEAEAAD